MLDLLGRFWQEQPRMKRVVHISLGVSLLCFTLTASVAAEERAPAWNPNKEKYAGGSGNVRPADVPLPASTGRGAKPAGLAVAALPGRTLTNASNTAGLRRDLVKGIMGAESQQGAKDSKLVDTRITAAPKGDASDLTTASWTEEWSVQRAAGKKATYVIAFAGQGKGKSIGYKVSMKP